MARVLVKHPWTNDAAVLLQHRVLDWANDHPGIDLNASTIAEHLGVDREALAEPFARLKAERLAVDPSDMRMSQSPVYWATLTPEGISAARFQREQARTRSVRLSACSDALLDWLYRHDGERRLTDLGDGPSGTCFISDVRANIYGIPFTPDDVSLAMKRLREHGLAKGIGTAQGVTLRLEITDLGRDVVEVHQGSVNGWRRSAATAQPGAVTFHFGDATSGIAVAVNSPGATQMVTQTNDHRQQLVGLADAFEQMLPVLGLSEGQEDEARTIIGELRKIEPDRDPGKVKRLLEGAGNLAVAGAGNAAGTGLVALIQKIAENWPF